jgi:hypothetical protein
LIHPVIKHLLTEFRISLIDASIGDISTRVLPSSLNINLVYGKSSIAENGLITEEVGCAVKEFRISFGGDGISLPKFFPKIV